jgi:hypothetical protein
MLANRCQQAYQTPTPMSQASVRWVPTVPLKTLEENCYQYDGTPTLPTPNNINYRLNDCIGCLGGHGEEHWKFFHGLLSKACYEKGTNFWALTCGQQRDAMLIYNGIKLCLENGRIVARAPDCLYGARWHNVQTNRSLPQRCINCDMIFDQTQMLFLRSKEGGDSVSKYTTIKNLKMKPDRFEKRLRDNTLQLRAYRRQENTAQLVMKRVEKKGVVAEGNKARGLEIAFQMVDAHIDGQVKSKSGALDANDPKVLLMKANFGNLQHVATRGFKRSRASQFDPILVSYAVQQCIKMGQKTYGPLADIFGWPSLRRVSLRRSSAIIYFIYNVQYV